jgi:hypothetical protein
VDCEEVHDQQRCPVCASESFAYLTRWVPVEERRQRRARPVIAPEEKPVTMRWATRGAVGLAAIALGRWVWQTTRRSDSEILIPRKRAGDHDEAASTFGAGES